MTKSLMASTFGVVFASVFISVVLVLFAVILFFVWWVDKKKRTIKDFFKSIGHFLYKMFDQINELASGDGVKTVYSDKSMNYSGTEFLPIPQKAPTDKYTYQFLGWDKNGVDENGNVVVKAIYLQKVQKCYISVYNEDRQTLLGSYEVEFGAGLNLENLKPSKAETKEFTYEFAGWDKDISAFYKNDNVYAVYRAIPKKFTYTFLDDDKSTVISQGTAIYGTPILPPPAPRKEAQGGKVFNFVGFANYTEGMTLTKDCSFVAVYEQLPESTVFAKSIIDTNGTQIKLNESDSDTNEADSPLAKKQSEVDRCGTAKAPEGAEFIKTSFDSEIVVSNEVKVEEDVVDASGEVVSSSTQGFVSPQTAERGNAEAEQTTEEELAATGEATEVEQSAESEVGDIVDLTAEEEATSMAEPSSESTPEPQVQEERQSEPKEERKKEVKEEKKSEIKEDKRREPREENKYLSFLYNRRKIIKKDDDKNSNK